MKRCYGIKGILFLIAIIGLAGCNGSPSAHQPKADAVAVLVPTEGSTVGGVVRFAAGGDGLRVMARIDNLSPGLHGFHIHQFGDCREPDAASAGAHFNPGNDRHGGPDATPHHIGDLGNVQANAHGVADVDRVVPLVRIDGPDSIIGRSVIVHADPDDLTSQPSGASGSRLACGVIGWAAR